MPGVPCSYEDVVRLDVPLPFFLRSNVYERIKSPDYSWNPTVTIPILVRNKRKNSTKISISSGTVDDDDEMNVSGCPLECPFDPNEDFDAVFKLPPPVPITFKGLSYPMDLYDPMDIKLSRSLVKKVYDGDEGVLNSLKLKKEFGKQGGGHEEVYMVVDGRGEAKDLTLLGCQGSSSVSELRYMGQYAQNSPFFSMDIFLDHHQTVPSLFPMVTVHKQVHAVYLSYDGEFSTEGKVYLEFVWNDPVNLMELPPPSALSKVAVRPRPGDANEYLKKLWSEVEVVSKLVRMREENVDEELKKTYYHQAHSTSNESGSSIVRRIQELIKLPSTPSWTRQDDFSNSIYVVLKKVLDSDRSDIDFTDKVWEILKEAESIPEIWECFFHIFASLEERYWKPYLFPSNTTYFGTLLKELSSEKIRNFRTILTPILGLEMAIDCGIQKLYRDYSYVLKMCHLCEMSDLSPFAPLPHCHTESLNSIKKLHCLLEVLCLSKDKLSLSMTEQETQTLSVLNYMTSNPLDWNHTFHFDIPLPLLQPLLTGATPEYWNLKLESNSALRTFRTNAIISRDLFISHIHIPPLELAVPKRYHIYILSLAHRRTGV